MTQQAEDIGALQTHIRHLRYAVATTRCHETVTVLRQMLSQAEANLQNYKRCSAALHPKSI